jgi:hypothetical protein
MCVKQAVAIISTESPASVTSTRAQLDTQVYSLLASLDSDQMYNEEVHFDSNKLRVVQ